jgi:alkanesulfonate monooxygenase SsuD/methylene tetrahydromethanopterin reductase-like flavin-dependent oxidoreductase (luciferase family)
MGVPWERRGARTDEMLTIIRGLLAGGYFEHHGDHFDVPAIKIAPIPLTPVPLLVGGHATPALRRAAEHGDGWIHGGEGDGADLAALVRRVLELRSDSPRAVEPFAIHAISLDAYSVDGVRRLAELGVTDVIVGFRYPYTRDQDAEPLQHKIDALRRYAGTVIAGCRAAG